MATRFMISYSDLCTSSRKASALNLVPPGPTRVLMWRGLLVSSHANWQQKLNPCLKTYWISILLQHIKTTSASLRIHPWGVIETIFFFQNKIKILAKIKQKQISSQFNSLLLLSDWTTNVKVMVLWFQKTLELAFAHEQSVTTKFECWIVEYPVNQGKQVYTSRTSDGTWCGTKRCWGFHANRLGIIYVNVTVCRTFHTFKQTGAVST